MADEPEGVTVQFPLRFLCPECGETVEVRDPLGLIRALHLTNACSVRDLLREE